MARAHYLVAERENGWFILLERTRYGPFPGGQAAALTAAVQAAQQAGKDGHEASVRLRAVDGRVCTAWAFGSDRYPPTWVEDLRLQTPVPRRARTIPDVLAPLHRSRHDRPRTVEPLPRGLR